ncbi:helix-turn-helix transcriptional regulator [Alkalilacustris brevis]|uniref:helix-turn-helix transcriptional regulator n=1 Tax=Alkalilacustris brevis TaxID=2026338 RepID=UPI000E0D4C47|nr:WYL domain-containing protein [Alkalilacustris brevis]
MRYEKAEQLLRLCHLMAARSQGVTLDMIGEEFGVSRRTAERMRDAALRLLPETEERTDEAGLKHWRASCLPKGLITIAAEDVTALHSAAEMMRGSNRPDAAGRLSDLATRLLALQDRRGQLRIEPDLDLLMQSEGLALRPGPRVSVAVEHLEVIREAILSARRIAVAYTRRRANAPRDVVLEPYGLLYGPRPYLIAKQAGKPAVRHYRLQGLSEVELTGEHFHRDEDFDLQAYGRRLFGVFNEAPFDVCWRFAPHVAEDAAEYVFHPDQTVQRANDGALIVRFRAAGALEMAWHLLTWGEAVEVLEPEDFWERAGIAPPGGTLS